MEDKISDNSPFEKQMYGALLRYWRVSSGYRKAEDFIAVLHEIGCPISKAALYRIERGEQEPSVSFCLATNLILCDDALSGDLLAPCIPPDWINPGPSLAKSKENSPSDNNQAERYNANEYNIIMNEISSFDFDVFQSFESSEDDLLVSVAHTSEDGYTYYDDIEDYSVQVFSDIERAVIQFLKQHGYELPGSEVEKLVRYAEEKIAPSLKEKGNE